MAVIKPNYPAINQRYAQLYPASIYARPALTPIIVGNIGAAQRNLTNQFKYSLQQLAVSPFSVNSESYMERIRATYNIGDSDYYKVMGMVGGFLGAGAGALIGSGLLKPQSWIKSVDTLNPFNKTFWKPAKNVTFRKPKEIFQWTGKFNPKRQANHEVLFDSVQQRGAYKKFLPQIDAYNDSLKAIKDYKAVQETAQDALTKADDALNAAQKKWQEVKFKTKSVSKAERDAAKKAFELAKQNKLSKADDLARATEDVVSATNKADAALDALKNSDDAFKLVDTGQAITKKSTGILPYVGTAIDIASLGLSTAGLVQSIKAGDPFHIAMNTIGVVGDSIAVLGDFVEFGLPGVGTVISAIGSAISIGSSVMTGWLAGQTVGHSLTPEGMIAQANFAQNLYASTIQRPISTIGTLAVMMGLPAVLSRLGRTVSAEDKGKIGNKILSRLGVRAAANWMSNTALGNFTRSAISMQALQYVNILTSTIDDQLPWAPQNPADVNFVTALSVYGDINDNLYGATRNKSILVGLASKDPDKMIEAMGKSWGFTNDMYHSVSFDDVRKALGWDLSPIGNSIFSTLGEILIDPQNIHEALQNVAEQRVVRAGSQEFIRLVEILKHKQELQGDKIIDELDALVTKEGILKHANTEELIQIVNAFVTTNDFETFKEQFVKMYTSFNKGSVGKYKVEIVPKTDQLELLYKTLTSLFNKGITTPLSSNESLEVLRNNYERYKEIVSRPRESLTPEEDLLLNESMVVLASIKKYYTDKGINVSDVELIDKFTEGLKLNITNKELVRLYRVDSNIRHHIDIANSLSNLVSTTTNPINKVVGGIVRWAMRQNTYSRSNVENKKRQDQIKKIKDIKNNLGKIPNTDTLKEAQKELDQRYKSVSEQLAHVHKASEHLIGSVSAQAEEDMKRINEEYQKNKEKIDTINKQLEKDAAQLEALSDSFVYFPKSYTFRGGKTVKISKETLKEHQDFVNKFESDENNNPLDAAGLEQKITRLKHMGDEGKAELEAYRNTKYALEDYTYHTQTVTYLKDLNADLKASVALFDSLNLSILNELRLVMSMTHIFKQYVNATREEKTIDILRDLLNNYKQKETALKAEIISLTEKAKELKKEDPGSKKYIKKREKVEQAKEELKKVQQNILKTNKAIKNTDPNDVSARIRFMDQEQYAALVEALKDTDKNVSVEALLARYNIKTNIFQTLQAVDPLTNKMELYLTFTYDKAQTLSDTVLKAIGSTDFEAMLRMSLSIVDDISYDKWSKMSSLEQTKFVIDLINSAEFDDLRDINKVISIETIEDIKNKIGIALGKDNITRTIQLGDGVSSNVIYAYVMNKILRGDSEYSDSVKKTIDQIKKMLNTFDTRLEKRIKGVKDSDKDFIRNNAYALYDRTMSNLEQSSVFRYVRAHLLQNTTIKSSTKLSLFNTGRNTDLIQTKILEDAIESAKKGHIYDSKDVLRQITETPTYKAIKETVEKELEIIKAKQSNAVDIEAINEHDEAVRAVQNRKKKSKKNTKELKTKVSNDVKRVLNTDPDDPDSVLNYYNRNNIVISKDTDGNPLFFSDFMTFLHDTDGRFKLKHNNNKYRLRQSKVVIKDGVKMQAVSYMDFMKHPSRNKDTYGHKEYLEGVAERLVELYRAKKIYIDESKLEPESKVTRRLSKQEYEDVKLVSRIVNTYLKKGYLDIYAKATNENKHRDIYVKSLKQAIYEYMYENKNSLDPGMFVDDKVSEVALKDFARQLKKGISDGDAYYLNIKNIILKRLRAILNDNLNRTNTSINDVDYILRDMAEGLFRFEQTDMSAFKQQNYQLATDVVSKMFHPDERTKVLLEDLINFDNPDYQTRTKTIQFIKLLNEHITENYADKKDLSIYNLKEVKESKGDFTFVFKDGNKLIELSLFDLVLGYKVPLITLYNFVKQAGRVMSMETSDYRNVTKLQEAIRTQYLSLVDTYGRFVDKNVLSVDEEAMKEIEGLTDEEIEILRNPDIAALYNQFNFLPSSSIKVTNEGLVTKSVYEKAPDLYNNKILKIYNNLKKQNKLDSYEFVMAIIKTRLDKDKNKDKQIKLDFLRNVFFHDVKVVRGKASLERKDRLVKEVERLRKLKPTLDIDKKEIDDKIKLYERLIKDVDDNYDKVIYGHLNKDNIHEYLLEHPELIKASIDKYYDTDSNKYIRVYMPDGTFVLAVKDIALNSRGTNVVDESKGVPNYNEIIVNDIIDKQDKNNSDVIKNNIKQNELWNVHLNKNTKVVSSKQGVVITVKDEAAQRLIISNMATYKKSLGLKKEQYLFVVTDKQYKDLEDMHKDPKKLTSTYLYTTTETDPTKVSGYINNIINYSSHHVVIPAYIRELEFISNYAKNHNQDVDTVMSQLKEYARIVDEKVYVSKAYTNAQSFNYTNTYRRLIKHAKVMTAVNDFINLLGNEEAIWDLNLNKLLTLFFKDKYIKLQEDGTFYNVDNIEKEIKNVNVKKYLLNTKVGNRTLLESIKDALRYMQLEYNASDKAEAYKQIKFDDYEEYNLSESFIDAISQLRNIANDVLINNTRAQSTAVQKVIPRLETLMKKYSIYYITEDELMDRNHLSEEYLNNKTVWLGLNTNAAAKNKDHIITWNFEDIKALKKSFSNKNRFGESVENLLYSKSSKLRKEYQRKTAKMNESYVISKYGINTNMLFGFYKYIEAFEKRNKENKESFVLPKSFTIPEHVERKLRDVAKEIHKVFEQYPQLRTGDSQELLKITGGLKNNQEKTYFAVEGYMNFGKYKLESVEDIYNFIVLSLTKQYLQRVTNEVRPEDNMTRMFRAQQETLFILKEQHKHDWEEYIATEQAALDFAKTINKIMADKKAVKPFYRPNKENRLARYTDDSGALVETPISILTLYRTTGILSLVNDSNFNSTQEVEVQIALNNLLDVIDKHLYEQGHKFTDDVKEEKTDSTVPVFDTVQQFYEAIPEEERVWVDALRRERLTGNIDWELVKDTNAFKELMKGKKVAPLGDIASEYNKIFYDINQKKQLKSQEFKSNYEIFNLLSTPMLNDNNDFMLYFRSQLDGMSEMERNHFLELFGIKTEALRNMIYNYSTLQEFMYHIQNHIEKDQMYALVQITNLYKRYFVAGSLSEVTKSGKWSWQLAHQVYVKNDLPDLISEIKQVRGMTKGDKAKVFGTNIRAAINDELAYLFDALSYTGRMNRALNGVIDLNAGSTEYGMEAEFVVRTNHKAIDTASKIQRDIIGNLFKKRESFSGVNIALQYEYAFGDAVIHLMAEEQANSVNEIGTGNVLYYRIVKRFTDLFEIINPNFKPKDFIRLSEIGTVLGDLLKNKSVVKFYSKQFNFYVDTLKLSEEQLKQYDTALDEIIKLFDEHSDLVDMDTTLAKAILGSIMAQGRKMLFKDDNQFKDALIKYTKEMNAADTVLKQAQYDSISQKLHASKNITQIMSIFEDLGTDPEVLKNVVNIYNYIKYSKGISATRLVDTIDYVNEKTNELQQEESTLRIQQKELEGRKTYLTNRLAGLNSFRSANLSKYNTDNESELKLVLEEKKHALDKVSFELALLQEELQKEYDMQEEAVDDYLLNIALNHPAILQDYINEQETHLNNFTADLEKAQTNMDKKYPAEFKEMYERIHARLNEIKAFFKTKKSQWLSLMGQGDPKEFEDRYRAYAEDLNKELGIKNYQELIYEYNKFSLKRSELNREKRELESNDQTYKVGDKEYKFWYKEKTYKKDLDSLEALQSRYDSFILNIDNVSDASRIEHARRFLSDVSNKYRNTSKASYKKFISSNTFDNLTIRQKNALRKSNNKKHGILNNYAIKLEQNVLRPLGVIDNIEKAEASINNILLTLDKNDQEQSKRINKLNNALRKVQWWQKEKAKANAVTEVLANNLATNVKDLVIKAFKDVLASKKIEIDGESIKDINEDNMHKVIDYVLNKQSKRKTKTITALEKKISKIDKQYKADKAAYDSLERYVDNNAINILETEEELKKVTSQLAELKVAVERAERMRREDKDISNSNSGTLRKLYPEYRSMNDGDLVSAVIERTAYAGKTPLLDVVINNGKLELHNDVVDTLITNLNYQAQVKAMGETLPDRYFVMDMETIDTPSGKTPYSVTLLIVEQGIVKQVITTKLNNSVFIAADRLRKNQNVTSDMLPYIEAFYKQQYDIAVKNSNGRAVDKETIRKETDAIINGIVRQANELENIETLLQLINMDSSTKIVAHNGASFDFPHYDRLMNTLADRTLINLYYRELSKHTVGKVKKAWKESVLGKLDEADETGALISMLGNSFEIIMKKAEQGNISLDRKEIDNLHDFNKAMWAVKATQAIEKAQADLGMLTDKDLKNKLIAGEDSKLNQAKRYVIQYLIGDDAAKSENRTKLYHLLVAGVESQSFDENNKKELIEEIDSVLKNAQETYEGLLNGESIVFGQYSDSNTLTQSVLSVFNKDGEKTIVNESFNLAEKIQDILAARKQNEERIEALLSIPNDTVITTLDEIKEEQDALNEIKRLAEQKIIELEKDINNLKEARKLQLKDVVDFAEKINNATARPVYRIQKYVDNNFEEYLKTSNKKYAHANNVGLLKFELDQIARQLQEELEVLKNIESTYGVENASTMLTKQIGTDYKDIFRIRNEEERAKYNKQILEDLEELNRIRQDLASGHIDFSNYNKTRSGRDIISQVRASVKNSITYIYKRMQDDWNKRFKDAQITDPEKVNYDKIIKPNISKLDPNKAEDLKLLGYLNYGRGLNKSLELYKQFNDATDFTKLDGVYDLIYNYIEYRKDILNATRHTLNSIKINDDNSRDVSVINLLFNTHLARLKNLSDAVETTKRSDIFNVLSKNIKRAEDMIVDPEHNIDEQAYYASQRAGDEYLKALDNPVVKRLYLSALRGNDKYAVELDPNKVYYSKNVIDDDVIYTFVVYDSFNDVVQKMIVSENNPNRVKFEITYKYTERGRELTKTTEVKRTISNDQVENEYGVLDDAKPIQAQFEALFDKSSNTRVRGTLTDDDIVLEDGVDASKQSIDRLYQFYKDMLSKDKKGVDLNKAKQKAYYDLELPLSALRSVNMTERLKKQLSDYLELLQVAKQKNNYVDINKVYVGLYNKLLSKFNALEHGKALNNISKDFSQGFVIKYDKKSLNEFANKTGIVLEQSSEGSAGTTFVLKSFYNVKVPFRQNTNTVRTLLSYSKLFSAFTPVGINNKYFVAEDNNKTFDEFLKESEPLVRELLDMKTYNSFIPTVLTSNMKSHYDRDILHKIGINLKVAFANDPRAWEDTILVDEDDAIALGWDEGNKTWLGLYGFKGAVEYVKGLRKEYGATFVASYSSIEDRKSMGAPLEMALNNIRDVLLGMSLGEHYKDAENYIKANIERIKKEFKPNKDGQIIVDEGKDYDKVLKNLGLDIEKLTTGKDKDGFSIKGGRIYVMMDAEHIAEHMTNEASVNDLGEIQYSVRNFKGSVEDGVVISPSVVYTMLTKGVTEWYKAFPYETEPLRKISNIAFKGIKAIFDNKKARITDEDLTKALEDDINKMFQSLIVEYVTEYNTLSDPAATEEQKKYAEYRIKDIERRIKNEALQSISGRNGFYYNAYYKKHNGIRQQLLANIDLGKGELKVSMQGFAALVKMEKGFLLHEDGTRFNEQERNQVLNKIKELEKDNTMTLRKKSEELENFLNEKFPGFFGRVMAIRSPVQDYNATPVMKIVGISKHHATEANAYLYSLIGGDNDGDTIGMAVVSDDSFTYLKNLDSTKDEYYDKGYIESIDKKLGRTKDNSFSKRQSVPLGEKDLRYVNTGKNTFERGNAIRKHFTWYEIYRSAFKEVPEFINDFTKGTKHELNINDLKLARIYINAAIRELTGGENFKDDIKKLEDYDDINKLTSFYNKYKELVDRIYSFDINYEKQQIDLMRYLTVDDIELYKGDLSKEYEDYINVRQAINIFKGDTEEDKEVKRRILFEKIYDGLMQNTVNRIQVSKRGVNIMGGNRKQQLVSSLVSTFADINGTFTKEYNWWEEEGFTNEDGSITLASIAKRFKASGKIDKTTYDKLSSSKELTKDHKELLKFVYEQQEANSKFMKTLRDIARDIKARSYDELAKDLMILKQGIAKEDPLVTAFIESIAEKDPKEYLTKVEDSMLGMILFGRFNSDYKKFKSAALFDGIDDFMKTVEHNLNNQYIISRKELNEISNNASAIIGVAKHFGFDINSSKYLDAYTTRVKDMTTKKGIQHANASDTNHILAMAIAMDRDIINKNNVRFDDAELSEMRKSFKVPDPVKIQQSYSSPEAAMSDYNKALKSSLKQEFFGNQFVPDETYNIVLNATQKVFEVFNKHKNIKDALKELKELTPNPLDTLIRRHIPFYRVRNSLINAYTLFKRISQASYVGSNKPMDITKISYLKDALYMFELGIILYSKEAQQELYSDQYKDFGVEIQWLLGTLEEDEKRYVTDPETNEIINAHLADRFRKSDTYTRESLPNILERMQALTLKEIGLDVREVSHGVLGEITKELISRVKNLPDKDSVTLNEIIDEVVRNRDAIVSLYDLKEEELNKIGKTKVPTTTTARINFGNSHVYNYFNIASYIEKMTELNQSLKDNKEKLRILNYDKAVLESTIKAKEMQLENIQKRLPYLNDRKNNKTLVEKLREHNKELEQKEEELKEIGLSYAFNQNFNKLVRYLTVDGKSIFDINTRNQEVRPLTNIDVRRMKERGILDFAAFQTPFFSVLEFYAIKNTQGTVIDYDWDAMYRWYKQVYYDIKLTFVNEGSNEEGLLRRLHDVVRKQDIEYKDLTDKQKKIVDKYNAKDENGFVDYSKLDHKKIRKLRRILYDQEHFKDESFLMKLQPNQLNDYIKDPTKIIFQGKTYDGLAKQGTGDEDFDIELSRNIMPVLTEIDVRSGEDLKEVFEWIKNYATDNESNIPLVGFTYTNDLMVAMNMSYKAYSLNDSAIDRFVSRLLHNAKLMMRLSPGFLFRNFMDTWNQLYSYIYSKHGYGGMMMNHKELFNYMIDSFKLYGLYNNLSQELVLYKAELNAKYNDMKIIINKLNDKSITVDNYKSAKEIINHLYYELDAWQQGTDLIQNKSRRIQYRSKQAEEHMEVIKQYMYNLENSDKIGTLKIIDLKKVEEATLFLLRVRFGEFYSIQQKIAEHIEAGNIKHTNSKYYQAISKFNAELDKQDKLGKKNKEDVRRILTELSYFMETEAQVDMYKQETSEWLNDYINTRLDSDANDTSDFTYEEIMEDVEKLKKREYKNLATLILMGVPNAVKDGYDWINQYIENTGRIGGFLIDRYLFNKNLNQTVAESLRRFFNYGQRSPQEVRLTTDIPYLSFPVRSITNWIGRLNNPSYLRLMSDIIDGVYEQYTDEDGRYNKYMQFQIQNGWIPIAGGVGMRFGNGAFDILNLLQDPTGQIAQRSADWQRALNERDNGFGAMLRQLAFVTPAGQILNAATALTGTRELAQQTPIIKDMVSSKPASLGTALNIFYDTNDAYMKYTPKQYQYHLGNGRYKYYENLYKDWFNKYGRMRKPKVDPLSLVKEIQWKQYVRWKRQNQYRKYGKF